MMENTSRMKKELECSSKRHFHWTTKVSNDEDDEGANTTTNEQKKKKKLQALALVFRLRFLIGKNVRSPRLALGTLFGNKRGHVHFALQQDAYSNPTLIIQLATPITGLVREMECGSIRITLESEKKGGVWIPLLQEAAWRSFYNGVKCGTATRIECTTKEQRILKFIEPISMGAGVIPAEGEEEEVIYMRSKFERVVGSPDSEALYMLNPDNNVESPPELSIYLRRI